MSKLKEDCHYPTMNPNGHNFEATKDVPLITVPTVATFFNIDPEKYTKTESEDGTITLKPKKKIKVWIEAYIDEFGYLDIAMHKSKEEIESSLAINKVRLPKTIEVIEREYEI